MSSYQKYPAKRRVNRDGFLDRYDARDGYLLRPDKAGGTAGILEGTAPSGASVLIRTWPGPTNEDIKEIWQNELRTLHRLGGAPGAEEYIARLVDADVDKKGFHIALATGERRPLAVLLGNVVKYSNSWLRGTSTARNRKHLWKNMARVATGLEILHSQGLLHCNLDAWSVLSSGGSQPDFQLTGFEWSMRLTAAADANGRWGSSPRPVSFTTDWADFAILAADLLKVDEKRVRHLGVPAHEVSENLFAEEAAFLRELLNPSSLVQLDGDYVRSRIERILTLVEDAAASEEARSYLVLNLGPDSKLSRRIREASELTVEVADLDAQKQFVLDDLSEAPRIVVSATDDEFDLFLRGRQLVYHLSAYRMPRAVTADWEFAICHAATPAEVWKGKVSAATALLPGSLDALNLREAGDRTPRLRGRVKSWEALRAQIIRDAPAPLDREGRILLALTLLHTVELVLVSADVFPVSVVSKAAEFESNGPSVRLNLQPDPDREQLSEVLGLRPMTDRLQEVLEQDAVSDDEGWLLTDKSTLGRRKGTDLELQFDAVKEAVGVKHFDFSVPRASLAPPAKGLLVPGDFQGRLAQLRRRSRALRGLKEHSELLRMLADPRSGLIETHDRLDDAQASTTQLDAAKAQALSELLAVLPLYLVQGPPGVGKTFLLRELVSRRLASEPSTRFLLTAQSHHAVDHLMSEIRSLWDDSTSTPLTVRCQSGQRGEVEGPMSVQAQARRLVDDLARSELAAGASDHLKRKLEEAAKEAPVRRGAQGGYTGQRALEGLILRAASLVFATTNSGELERLVDERGQFDWAIVEEAGKATGGELLMPLLLSYRRLMIGDHKQLPPFGAEKLERLLQDPTSLRGALTIGLALLDRELKAGISDELLARIEDDEVGFAEVCAEALRMLYLFETMIEAERRRVERPGSTGRPIGRILDIQHRMHPALATLVSDCFYDGKIKTADAARAKFLQSPSPIKSTDPQLLPETPIVVVNMPYRQSTMSLRSVEAHPRYSSPGEVEAVVRLVSLLEGTAARSDGSKPSLAILSPYAKQVAGLHAALQSSDPARDALRCFRSVTQAGSFCSTVDAFQGNEADAVVVSFVRNNQHATPRRALGFLSDPRRMNVLLSRARWRLFIVTSLDFLETVTRPLGLEQIPEAAFLRRFLDGLEKSRANGSAAIVPLQHLFGGQR